MKDGEGTKENSYSVVSSPCVPTGNEFSWQSQKSEDDGDDYLTEYSSCDGESEFERYCSANSAMGTPTVSGSVVTAFNEFPGSFKLGDDSYKVKNFRGWKKLSDFSRLSPSTGGSGYSDVMGGEQKEGLVGNGKGFDLYGNAEYGYMDEEIFSQDMDMGNEWYSKDDEMPSMRSNNTKLYFNGSSCTSEEYKNGELIGGDTETSRSGNNSLETECAVTEEDTEFRKVIETVDGSLVVPSVQLGMATGDESETSSRYEHSEGEESMFGGNTDDENQFALGFRREIKHSLEHDKNENELVMGSAVAFGSDDWDDFMQENGEVTVNLMVHNELQVESKPNIENENGCLSSISTANTEFSRGCFTIPREEEKWTVHSYHDQGGNGSTEQDTSYPMNSLGPKNLGEGEHAENVEVLLVKNNQIKDVNESAKYHGRSSFNNLLQLDHNLPRQPGEASLTEGAKLKEEALELTNQCAYTEEVSHIHDDLDSRKVEPDNLGLFLDPLSHCVTSKDSLCFENADDRKEELSADQSSSPSSASVANDLARAKHRTMKSLSSVHYFDDHLTPTKTQPTELNEFYSEVVHDMEEILLDYGESPGFALGNKIYYSYIPLPSRDGGSTASTSITFDGCHVTQPRVMFDGVEVIGAKQKTGDVSLSERLVGVKKYTVYRIKVLSGEHNWEVERRYRDFYALYRQLKMSSTDQGWLLPPVWSGVEQESRKFFGSASPDVIADRSVLIQECLHSLLHANFPSGPLSALICFLSPSKDVPNSPVDSTNMHESPCTLRSSSTSLGKTISLIVHIRRHKSKKQLLDEQHYSCAGCYKSFNDRKTRIQEIAQTLGWAKPRLCEYSGQLYCSSCHTNDMAVLPARVLHFWDFNQYPVSQLAKSYLDSIHDQPMLCVSAVNPMLFSRVPALQHVTDIRKKIEKVLPFVHCPFRNSIHRGVGSRRYLLESNDFFALRDLVDLSKGVFAALPVMVDTILRKIQEHITEQCLICYDVGIPCSARQACEDPSSLIFPFQEGDTERCKSCNSIFHNRCFKRISACQCGQLKLDLEVSALEGNQRKGNSGIISLDLLGKRADFSTGLVSGLLGKVRSLKSSKNDEGYANNNAVISMDSLPMTTL